MSLLWGKDSQVSRGGAKGSHGNGCANPSANPVGAVSPAVEEISPAGKPSGLSTDSVAQSEKAGRPATPRVYSAWIDDFSDDLYQFAEPSYTPRSTFSERVAEIALCGFILLALIGVIAGWF